MKKEQIKKLYDSKFMKMYDLQYKEGAHYYCASRRDEEHLQAVLPKESYDTLPPDGVSCVVVLRVKGEEPKLLLNWEYRYPAGQYLLSVPAGLVEPEAWGSTEEAVKNTAIRELKEETGITVGDNDEVSIINPFVFSSPGMTDEANALVYLSINRETMPELSQSGAEGSEKFKGCRLVSLSEARSYLVNAKDEHGVYYPVYTWAALMFFVTSEFLNL